MEICCSTAIDDYAVDLAVEPERTGSVLEFTVSRAGQPVAALDGPVQLFVRHGETPIDTEPATVAWSSRGSPQTGNVSPRLSRQPVANAWNRCSNAYPKRNEALHCKHFRY